MIAAALSRERTEATAARAGKLAEQVYDALSPRFRTQAHCGRSLL
jgi:hypothetical protein